MARSRKEIQRDYEKRTGFSASSKYNKKKQNYIVFGLY